VKRGHLVFFGVLIIIIIIWFPNGIVGTFNEWRARRKAQATPAPEGA
jgi:ABC-type branched-subunit amino acid transport system permease subunit